VRVRDLIPGAARRGGAGMTGVALAVVGVALFLALCRAHYLGKVR
jgi:hypothetical protein